eukprot:gene5124-4141_t
MSINFLQLPPSPFRNAFPRGSAFLCSAVLAYFANHCDGGGYLPEFGEQIPAATTCSLRKFDQSLSVLLNPMSGMLNDWDFGRGLVRDRYKELLANGTTCEKVPNDRWPISSSYNRTDAHLPLIINPGEGTTATRFFNSFFAHLGFKAAHNIGTEKTIAQCHGASGKPCTEVFDAHRGYISDTPVAQTFWELLHTHPDAIIVHTLRPAVEWHVKRMHKHKKQHAEDWHQASVCGEADHPMADPKTPLDYMVYNVWARCIAVDKRRHIPPGSKFATPADYYIGVNVFQNATASGGRNDILNLLLFLRNHGVLTEGILPKSFEGQVSTISDMANALNTVLRDPKHEYQHVDTVTVPLNKLKVR